MLGDTFGDGLYASQTGSLRRTRSEGNKKAAHPGGVTEPAAAAAAAAAGAAADGDGAGPTFGGGGGSGGGYDVTRPGRRHTASGNSSWSGGPGGRGNLMRAVNSAVRLGGSHRQGAAVPQLSGSLSTPMTPMSPSPWTTQTSMPSMPRSLPFSSAEKDQFQSSAGSSIFDGSTGGGGGGGGPSSNASSRQHSGVLSGGSPETVLGRGSGTPGNTSGFGTPSSQTSAGGEFRDFYEGNGELTINSLQDAVYETVSLLLSTELPDGHETFELWWADMVEDREAARLQAAEEAAVAAYELSQHEIGVGSGSSSLEVPTTAGDADLAFPPAAGGAGGAGAGAADSRSDARLSRGSGTEKMLASASAWVRSRTRPLRPLRPTSIELGNPAADCGDGIGGGGGGGSSDGASASEVQQPLRRKSSKSTLSIKRASSAWREAGQ